MLLVIFYIHLKMVFRKACGMVPDVNIILTAPVAEVYREQ